MNLAGWQIPKNNATQAERAAMRAQCDTCKQFVPCEAVKAVSEAKAREGANNPPPINGASVDSEPEG